MRLALALLLALASPVFAESALDDPAATVIEVTGEALFDAGDGSMKPIELGQLFAEGDRLKTGENSGLHLVLADGSSLALGPNSELSVSKLGRGGEGSSSLFELLKGTLNAIVEKLTVGAAFEVKTSHAIAAVKGTQFEVAADDAESAVTVREGVVAMSDPDKKKTVEVGPLQRCSASPGRLNPSFRLAKREAGEFEARWERARTIHSARADLMRHFEQQLHQRKAVLQARKAALRKNLKDRAKERDRKSGEEKKSEMKDRKKAARERFEKAREEIKKERRKKRDK